MQSGRELLFGLIVIMFAAKLAAFIGYLVDKSVYVCEKVL